VFEIESTLEPRHLEELQNSAIDPQIIALNFESLDGEQAAEALLYKVSRRNGGRVSDKYTHYQNLGEGWWCAGVRIETGDRIDWGCFKPDSPRIDKAKDKPIKYEHPPATSTEYFALAVPFEIGAKIARRYGLGEEYAARQGESADSGEDRSFWPWVLTQKSIPLFKTEGAKKAACLLSIGYLAIGLPGIWGAHRSGKDEGLPAAIIPGLRAIVAGRVVVIVFDADSNPDTAKEVGKAANTTLKDCRNAGAVATGRIAWDLADHPHKGIDDLIATEGAEGFDLLVADFADRQTAVDVKASTKAADDSDEEKCEPRHYESSIDEGLVLVTREERDDGTFKPVRKKIGNHLEAIAYVNSPEGNGASIYLEFKSLRGHLQRWSMPRAYLVADTPAMLAELTSRGYHFKLSMRKELLTYLNDLGQDIDRTYTITENTGWVKDSFVLPHKTYGDQDIRFRDIEPSPETALTEVVGTKEGWDSTVGIGLPGNSRLIFFGYGVAVAAPLMRLVGLEPGGFHMVGETSKGKTAILCVAASVFGYKAIGRWRSTVNGLEGIATAYNDLCLLLDELGQAEARDVGSAVYMLGNGTGKQRQTKELKMRKPKIFRNMILSSGEVGIADYMKSAGEVQKGGQAVRVVDVPACPPGARYGCFENVGPLGKEGDTVTNAEATQRGREFVGGLESGARANHGAIGDLYLSRLSADLENPEFIPTLVKKWELISANLSRGYIDSTIGRASERFALVQVALGLAHSYGLLPIPAKDIEWAVQVIFKDWIDGRGGDGSTDIKNACDAIGHTLTTTETSERFFTLPDNSGQKTRNQIGYRKLELLSTGHNGTEYGGTDELWVFPEVFRRDFCAGVNPTEVARELVKRGWLIPDSDGKATRPQKINGKATRVYVFQEWAFSGVTGVTGVTAVPELVTPVTPEKALGVTGVTAPPMVTPVTPIERNGVTAETSSQLPVTPVTPVTPPKQEIPKNGTSPIKKLEEC
jgi:putative DNA primase/helicase